MREVHTEQSMRARAMESEATYAEAKALGAQHGLRLTHPSDGCYQLRSSRGWIVNLFPRRKQAHPLILHDRHHRGPYLQVPADWTLLDVVQAAVKAEEGKP